MGGSLRFDSGNSEYLDVDTSTDMSSDYTISSMCWFKPDSVTPSIIGTAFWVGDLNFTASFDGVAHTDDKAWMFAHRNNVSNNEIIGSTTINTTTWVHVACINYARNSRELFVNGASDGTNTYNSNTTMVSQPWDGIAFGRANDSSPGVYFDGVVAHAHVYLSGLVAAQIQELMYNPFAFPKSDLHAQYTCMESISAASDILDYSGNGFDMTGGTIPDSDSDSPPIHLFPGGM